MLPMRGRFSEYITPLKDAAGNVLERKPFPGAPVVNIAVLIPPSAQLGDGTIEQVILSYDPVESDSIKDALAAKYGTSHPPEAEEKINPKIIEEYLGAKLISQEIWKPGWGELMLEVGDKYLCVSAKTQKLISFEQANKKDEF